MALAEERLANRWPGLKQAIALYGDEADPDKIGEWQKAGFRMIAADKRPQSVIAGIETVLSVELAISEECFSYD